VVDLRGGIGLSLQSSLVGPRPRTEEDAIESDDTFRSVRAGAGEKLAARVERLKSNSNFIVRRSCSRIVYPNRMQFKSAKIQKDRERFYAQCAARLMSFPDGPSSFLFFILLESEYYENFTN
jgi:GH35 family endo-1,4-beta-xylanase